MAKEMSEAPKERVNIVYRPAMGDQKEEKELPFKTLVVGDFTLRNDPTRIEDRKVIDVNKNNFNDVLKEQNLELKMNVRNRLSGDQNDEDNQMPVNLKFENIKDFNPDQIAENVPELKQMLELRESLKALKGPLGNVPAFRKKLESLVGDEGARERLIGELKLDEEADGTEEEKAPEGE